MTKHRKILGITLDSKQTFSQHINVTISKAKQMLVNILKASLLLSGENKLIEQFIHYKENKLFVSKFKAMTCPILKDTRHHMEFYNCFVVILIFVTS